MKVELVGFVVGLELGCKKKKGYKMILRILVWLSGMMGFLFNDMGKIMGRVGLGDGN